MLNNEDYLTCLNEQVSLFHFGTSTAHFQNTVSKILYFNQVTDKVQLVCHENNFLHYSAQPFGDEYQVR